MTKAVCLLSGGLDSMLAIRVMLEQQIEVEAVTLVTPFFSSINAEKAVKILGVNHHIIDFTEEHLEMLKKPKYGYGKHLNPCIDCHALMVKKSGQLMEKIGASFIVTGEVLGERPKSQNKQALWIVEKESGYPHQVLRPLSAKLLPETIPEKEKLVDRDRLMAIEGRSRKEQFKLVELYGIKNYPAPAGGCLLTEPVFSNRLKELYKMNPDPDRLDMELLKVGRHFFLEEDAQVVVGRNEEENGKMKDLTKPDDILIKVKKYPGPLTILRGRKDEDSIQKASLLTARYSKAKDLKKVDISLTQVGGKGEQLLHSTGAVLQSGSANMKVRQLQKQRLTR